MNFSNLLKPSKILLQNIWTMHDFNYKLTKEAKEDYWEIECLNHPTSNHCKIY